MQRYIGFLLRNRFVVLLVCGLLTAGSVAVIAKRAVLGSSLASLLLGEDPEYFAYLERIRQFVSDEVVILVVEDADVLSPDTLDRLERAVRRMEGFHEPCGKDQGKEPAAAPPVEKAAGDELAGFEEELRDEGAGFEDVDAPAEDRSRLEIPEGMCATFTRVDSVLRAEHVYAEDRELVVLPFASEARKHPERAQELLEKLRSDRLAGGFFVSKDGKHTAIVLEMAVNQGRAAERGPIVVREAEQALVDEGFSKEKIRVVGFLAVLSSAIEQTNRNFGVLFPITVVVLLAVVFLMFRRLWPVALSMGVSGIGVSWSVAFGVILEPSISVMHSIVPAVMLIVGFSDVIHLCSAYLIELGTGKSREEAIIACGVDVGKACVYTSATTFVGFVGMSFVPTPAFRQLGIILGFGVAVALLLAITLTPIAFSLMPTPRTWRVGATSRVQALLDRLLEKMAYVTTRRPWTVIGCFAAAAAIFCVGLWQFHVDTNLTKRFDADSRVQKDADFFSEHFVRANYLQFFVDTPEESGLFDPRRFAALAAFQAAAEKDPDVERVVSIVDLVRLIHEALNADDPAVLCPRGPDAPCTPALRETLAEYLLLYEMRGGTELRRMVDGDRRTALLSVRVLDEGVRSARKVGDRLAALAGEHLGPEVKVQPSGILYVLGGWLDALLLGQGKGLIFTIVLISLMMAVGLGSLRLGLWSMVPNIFPLLALGAYLGVAYEAADSDCLVLAMLAIGIGVDDTIHFVMRYKLEASRTTDRALALERTYGFAGRAILIATLTLAAGFAPFALSEYLTIWFLGALLPMTLFVALVADLLLVPAMATVGLMAYRTPEPESKS